MHLRRLKKIVINFQVGLLNKKPSVCRLKQKHKNRENKTKQNKKKRKIEIF